MDENELIWPIPASAEDVVSAENRAIEEAGPKICPICNSALTIFYVHYDAKMLICQNMKCIYPFHNEFKVYESDDDGYFQSELDISSIKRKKNRKSNRQATSTSQGYCSGPTGSEVSTSEWSDIARLNMTYDSDDSYPSNVFVKKNSQTRLKRVKIQENEEKIKQNVEKIKELNKVLFDNVDECDTIRNEKWIKNLSSLQSSSGMRLVKDQELKKLKKNQKVNHIGELKIDIEARKDSMSSIKIEISNKCTAAVNNKRNMEV